MQRAKFKSLYFAIIAALAIVAAAYLAAELHEHELPMLQSFDDIASAFSKRGSATEVATFTQ